MQNIKQILQQWNKSFINFTEVRNSEKIMYRVVDYLGKSYVFKGEKANAKSVEQNCEFANKLRACLPTPHYYKTIHHTFTVIDGDHIFTLEENLTEGEEVNTLTDVHLKEIALKLAIMHRYTLSNNITLQKATSWSMFGGNKTDEIGDYDENELSFQAFEQAFHQHSIFPGIKKKYTQSRKTLKKAWSSLPKAATQGDYCYYNMRFKEEKLVALFDFNLAGDEVLLNECTAVAIYLSWHVPYEGALTSEERYQLFMQQYETERPLTMQERKALPTLHSIIRAFRYDRVENGIKDTKNAELFLTETWRILNT